MTQYELLTKLNGFRKVPFDPIIDAIRAVVILHKPREITLPNGEWGANCGHCDIGFIYPCPTIQAIEKELN